MGELQEEVAKLRSIHTHRELIENLHMETSKVEEVIQLARTAVTPPGEDENYSFTGRKLASGNFW